MNQITLYKFITSVLSAVDVPVISEKVVDGTENKYLTIIMLKLVPQELNLVPFQSLFLFFHLDEN